MQQVIDRVENGEAPAVLNASGSINGQSVTRPLCPYPAPDAIYTAGDPNVAASYTCGSRPYFTNPFLLNGQHDGWHLKTADVSSVAGVNTLATSGAGAKLRYRAGRRPGQSRD